jgi:hypothetical protein
VRGCARTVRCEAGPDWDVGDISGRCETLFEQPLWSWRSQKQWSIQSRRLRTRNQKGRRAFSFTSFMTKKVRVCLTPGRAISFCPCSLLKSAMSRTRIFSR